MPATTTPTDFKSLVNFFIEFANLGITVIFALTLVVLIWGVIDAWIIHADDEEKRRGGRTLALTAALVLVVMAGIWGILNVLVT